MTIITTSSPEASLLIKELQQLKRYLSQKGPLDEAQFRKEANIFYQVATKETMFPIWARMNKLRRLVQVFQFAFEHELSFHPSLRQVSIMTDDEDGGPTIFIHYRGQIRLAGRRGLIQRLVVELIHEKDTFVFKGVSEVPDHSYRLAAEGRGRIVGGYSVTYFRNGGIMTFVMDQAAMTRAYELGVAAGNGSFWDGPHHPEMYRKSVVTGTNKRWLEMLQTESAQMDVPLLSVVGGA